MGGLKRIILTVSNDISYDQRMQRICRSLSGAGYEVILVGRKKRSSIRLEEQPYRQKRFQLPFEKGKLFYLALNIRLLFYLLTHRFDLVCGIDLDTIVPCIWAAKLKGKTILYDAHEWFPQVPEVHRRKTIKRAWERIEKYALKRIDYGYTVSQGIVDIMQNQYNRSFELIRNVPLYENLTIGEGKEKQIIYQGALNEGRALEPLIRAMHHIDATLILAGEGDLSTALRQLVEEEQLTHKVMFKGYIQPAALKTITANAMIGYNLLEKSGGNYYLSLCNKFFDYIHAGIPSITIDFPEYRAINEIHDVALLLPNTDPATITQGFRKLMDDTDLYNRLRENCLKAREILNWQNEENKLLDLYRKAVKNA